MEYKYLISENNVRSRRTEAPLGYEAYTPRRSIRWIDQADALMNLYEDLAPEQMIGLDVETTLRSQSLCLLQIATSSFTAIVDPLAIEDLGPLFSIFKDPDVCIVIHNAPFERSVLKKFNCEITNVFDTLRASRTIRGKRKTGHSLAAVCRRELNIHLDKQYQRSDWRRRPLSRGQINYAALDAEVLIDLHRIFHR